MKNLNSKIQFKTIRYFHEINLAYWYFHYMSSADLNAEKGPWINGNFFGSVYDWYIKRFRVHIPTVYSKEVKVVFEMTRSCLIGSCKCQWWGMWWVYKFVTVYESL